MAEEEEESGGGKSKLILIIIILVVLIGGGVGAFLFLSGSDEEEASLQSATNSNVEEQQSGASSQNEPLKLANPLFTPARNYTVNLRDGKHFLKISVVAVLEDPNALTFLGQRMPVIDDMVISLLHNATSDDLRTAAGIDILKRELYKKINNTFTQEFIDESESKDTTPVKKILFKEFLIN